MNFYRACSSFVGDAKNWHLSLFDDEETRHFPSREISYLLVALLCVLADFNLSGFSYT